MSAPADAVSRSWVEHAPHSLQPYLRLMRLDRPIGVWLLFWPCAFGIGLGAAVEGHRDIRGDLRLLALFAIGAIVMRGAGCTYNDIVDRDIDAQVARTKDRPLASGAIRLRAAWTFLALQCATGFAVLLTLNRYAIALGASSLILVAIYPFMKRITWWPQAWLGLTFNWGALLGYAARTGHLSPAALLLYGGCVFWTLGYDTIYAHQDKEDDALIGVKSTARLFGGASRGWILIFYLVALALLLASAQAARPSLLFITFFVLAAGQMLWQIMRLDIDCPARCLAIFRSNRNTGALLAAAFLAAAWFRL